MKQHYVEQAYRILRLFVAAFVATGVLGHAWTKAAIVGAIVAAVETVWRELSMVAPVAKAQLEPKTGA